MYKVLSPIISVDPTAALNSSDSRVTIDSDRIEIIEEDADSRTAIFTVARGAMEGDLTLLPNNIAGVGNNPTSAEDFKDSLTTGSNHY